MIATNRLYRLALLVLTLLAFGLRLWRLDQTPPGWRDDELINSLVISQKALDGEWAVYYPDASGHEALFHLLNAGALALFGPGVAGIRLVPALLGVLTIPLTYGVAGRLFGRRIGLLAAAALALSFWSLMYSRIGLRHISLPVIMLSTFFFFLRGLDIGQGNRSKRNHSLADFTAAGCFMGIGFYTYFPSRGLPLILLAFIAYQFLFQRDRLRGNVKGILLSFTIAAVLAIPLVITLNKQPEAEARVAELAVPLVEASKGNFSPLGEHIIRTLNMAHADGDEEWLYNIPFRPLFGPIGAVFFWSGLAIALWHTLGPILPARFRSDDDRMHAASAFITIWWLAGISPAFISVPAASLGHTIIAQPAFYILAVLPIGLLLRNRNEGPLPRERRFAAGAAALLLLSAIATRDLPDYFERWPARGLTRFLYRADIKELAIYLNDHPELVDFGVEGLLAGPWDRLALEIDLDPERRARPRWYDPRRVTLLALAGQPGVIFTGYPRESDTDGFSGIPVGGGFHRSESNPADDFYSQGMCFRNGLCASFYKYDPGMEQLAVAWEAAEQWKPPSIPLISNPPPPGVYAGPRLLVFAHMVDGNGAYLGGDDGLWIDVATLQPGDRFLQAHRPVATPGSEPEAILFGLYDPLTGQRILTQDGVDHIRLELAR